MLYEKLFVSIYVVAPVVPEHFNLGVVSSLLMVKKRKRINGPLASCYDHIKLLFKLSNLFL